MTPVEASEVRDYRIELIEDTIKLLERRSEGLANHIESLEQERKEISERLAILRQRLDALVTP